MSQAALDGMMGAPEHQIRAILLALCDDTAVRQRALKHYAALQSFNSEATGLKRKAAGDLCICVQCDSPFYKEDNVQRACRYHPDVHGTWDTPENQEEYPEGFMWTCCDKAGDASGCTKGNHEAHPDRSKKATVDGASSGSGNADHITIDDEDDGDDEE
ncbi:hypothetical protein BKA56DRAFT_667489 [Ilyonectria sp. MPI-CAGE-AT-0026]|nr:hypothetical protein BKA56DRAFT_667489 [Ilyonectria sp. MPI-CAGE-AT-0026]